MTDKILLPEGIPPLTGLYFYLTEGCNLACQHCWLSPIYQPKGTTGGHLAFNLFKLALEESLPLGLRNVKLTGGEPLLHPDFFRMIDFLKQKNLKVILETNCTLMTPEIASYLKEKSTVDFISTSIDGSKPDTHDAFRGVSGSYQKAVAGLKMLVEVGYHPQVIMSLHSGNVNEIEDLVYLAESWKADSVKFNIIQPTGRGEIMAKKGQVLDIHQLIKLGNWVEQNLQKRVNIHLEYSWPMIFHSLDWLIRSGGKNCAIFNILGVLANGNIAMCGIGMTVPELTYGQLGRDSILDVWRDNPIIKQIRMDLPDALEGICAECLFKWQCLGNCVAENYFQTKRITAPYWFCEQANREGLLPIQRTMKSVEIMADVNHS